MAGQTRVGGRRSARRSNAEGKCQRLSLVANQSRRSAPIEHANGSTGRDQHVCRAYLNGGERSRLILGAWAKLATARPFGPLFAHLSLSLSARAEAGPASAFDRSRAIIRERVLTCATTDDDDDSGDHHRAASMIRANVVTHFQKRFPCLQLQGHLACPVEHRRLTCGLAGMLAALKVTKVFRRAGHRAALVAHFELALSVSLK